MTHLFELVPGDVVTLGGEIGFYVARTRHPIWQHLELVIWRRPDGSWSHDALHREQDIGRVLPSTAALRAERLRAVLLGEWRIPDVTMPPE